MQGTRGTRFPHLAEITQRIMTTMNPKNQLKMAINYKAYLRHSKFQSLELSKCSVHYCLAFLPTGWPKFVSTLPPFAATLLIVQYIPEMFKSPETFTA